ncbi:hypothetical protein JCM8547_001476 [Rhodosporidiobolus lusitaniae]
MPAPSTSTAPSPTPSRPLSAVAARRAAREAAQAAQAVPSAPAAAPSTVKKAPAASTSSATNSPSSSSSTPARKSSSISTNGLAKAEKAVKQPQGKKGEVGKDSKGKGKAPVRYFAPPEQPSDADAMLVDADGSEEEEEDAGKDSDGEGAVSPPEGLDEGEEKALSRNGGAAGGAGRRPSEVEADEIELSTPNKRRRREKSAFVDPFCVSAFQVVDGVSAVRTTVLDESGAEVDAVVYALQEGENLILHGTFLLAPIFGSVFTSGASLLAPPPSSSSLTLPALAYNSPSSRFHRFFSPSSHPLSPIYAQSRSSESYDSPTAPLLLRSGDELDLFRFAAAVVVVDLETGVEGIERPLMLGGMGCASGMWPRRGKTVGLKGGKTWKLITDPTPSLTSLRPMPQWDGALAEALPVLGEGATDSGRFVAFVEGPKRVGKSTLARTLVNALLDRYESVAYLNTDLGQPEFTAPGFLSIHILRRPVFGPSFTHLALPLSSHYLGSPSPASDPSTYIAAAQALLEIYALEVEYPLVDEPSTFSRRRGGRFARQAAAEQEGAAAAPSKIRERVPLVINTQGWVKGLGADLLQQLKAASLPTHVFSFSTPDGEGLEQYQGDYEQQQSLPYRVLMLPPAPPSPLESKWSAADYRILGLTSYFHAAFPSSPTSSTSLVDSWDFSRSLVASPPFPFSWSAESQHLHSVHLTGPGASDGEITYEHVLHALNGSVVAILASSSAATTPRSTRPFPYDPTTPLPSPLSSRALGLALVHSIDPSTSTLNLLTPLPPALIASAAPVVLVKGALELPMALMLDYSVRVTDAEREGGVAGWRFAQPGPGEGAAVGEEKVVPFLSTGEGESAVGGKRRVRRNLMRRAQA